MSVLIARRMCPASHPHCATDLPGHSIAALMQRLLPVTTFTTLPAIQAERHVEREALTGGLLRLGYRRVSVVETQASFVFEAAL